MEEQEKFKLPEYLIDNISSITQVINWHKIFIYDEGSLFWKIKPAYNVNIGDLAGNISKSSNGYCSWRISYNRITFTAARIIWEMFNGEIPKGFEIDHKDLNSLNNRIENLRLATRQEQMFNTTLQKNNTSRLL